MDDNRRFIDAVLALALLGLMALSALYLSGQSWLQLDVPPPTVDRDATFLVHTFVTGKATVLAGIAFALWLSQMGGGRKWWFMVGVLVFLGGLGAVQGVLFQPFEWLSLLAGFGVVLLFLRWLPGWVWLLAACAVIAVLMVEPLRAFATRSTSTNMDMLAALEPVQPPSSAFTLERQPLPEVYQLIRFRWGFWKMHIQHDWPALLPGLLLGVWLSKAKRLKSGWLALIGLGVGFPISLYYAAVHILYSGAYPDYHLSKALLLIGAPLFALGIVGVLGLMTVHELRWLSRMGWYSAAGYVASSAIFNLIFLVAGLGGRTPVLAVLILTGVVWLLWWGGGFFVQRLAHN